MEGNLSVLLCLTLYLRAISKYKPLGGLHLEGRFNGGFFALRVWGARLYLEGLIFEISRHFPYGHRSKEQGSRGEFLTKI